MYDLFRMTGPVLRRSPLAKKFTNLLLRYRAIAGGYFPVLPFPFRAVVYAFVPMYASHSKPFFPLHSIGDTEGELPPLV